MTRPILLFESILSLAQNCQFSDDFWGKIQVKAEALNKIYGITPVQCVISSLLLNMEGMSITEMGEYIGLLRIHLLQYDDEFDEMIQNRMLIREENHYRGRRVATYRLTAQYEKAIRKGLPLTVKSFSEYTTKDLCCEFKEISNVNKMICEEEDMAEQIYEQFHTTVMAAKHLPTVNALEELSLEPQEWLFAWTLITESLTGNGKVDIDDFENVVPEDTALDFFKDLERERTLLQQKGLVESCINQGFMDTTSYRLSIEGYEELCPEIKSPQLMKIQALTKNLMAPQSIQHKELFFNSEDQQQIDRLRSLLLPNNYNSIVERMLEEGLRTGFCCLFFGSPGTGKTELVYQLAKSTNRGIFQVDISTVRDKFVGESEKIIKSYFTRYKKMVKAQRKVGKLEPIMLLNEADAILTQRKVKSLDAVDKMENSVQNIILQALEDLDGILIATTNLEANLDEAFKRRFLYKLEFTKPDVGTRAKIVGSMWPELYPEDAYKLAEMYDLSGGQWENIRRKAQVDYILSGQVPKLETLSTLCQQETLHKQQSKRIGFC